MTPEQAVKAIQRLVRIEVQMMKQLNTRRGITKASSLEESKAIMALFNALTDEHPTTEQMQEMACE